MSEDLFLLRLKPNDDYSRCFDANNNGTDICKKYRQCKHLFVVVKKSQYFGAFHSSDCETTPERVECVHCGLTNRLIDAEERIHFEYATSPLPRLFHTGLHGEITAEFVRQFGWKNEGLDKWHFLSREELPSYHPGVLFQIARELYFYVGNFIDTGESEYIEDSIFAIMKELHNEETPLERVKISSVVHASALIERYKKKHNLYIDSTS